MPIRCCLQEYMNVCGAELVWRVSSNRLRISATPVTNNRAWPLKRGIDQTAPDSPCNTNETPPLATQTLNPSTEAQKLDNRSKSAKAALKLVHGQWHKAQVQLLNGRDDQLSYISCSDGPRADHMIFFASSLSSPRLASICPCCFALPFMPQTRSPF